MIFIIYTHGKQSSLPGIFRKNFSYISQHAPLDSHIRVVIRCIQIQYVEGGYDMNLKERIQCSDFYRVFNFRTPEAEGRSLLLINNALASVANAVITGSLYTAFLAENGIDIVSVGIISFIPYIAWMLSIFSPMIMSRLRKRQKILLLNDYIYYTSIVLATTVMPLFVKEPTARTIWFAALLFIGHASNALLGSGYTTWHLKFVPAGRDLNIYTSYNNLCGNVFGNATGLIASFVATLLANSPNQYWLLFGLRVMSFTLFIIGTSLVYLKPKETPVKLVKSHASPLHVLTEPIRHRKFLMTAMFTVWWGIVSTINGGTYGYYLLETVKVPILFTYTGAVVSMIAGVFLSNVFRRFMDLTSPFTVLKLSIGLFTVLEFFNMLVGPGDVGMYIALTIVSSFVGVLFSMGYSTLFYLHLPEKVNKDVLSTFWNLIANVSGVVGAGVGTWLLAQFETHGVYEFLSREWYGSQILCGIKGIVFAGMLAYVVKVTPILKRTDM